MSEPRVFRPQLYWQPAGTKFDFHAEAEEYDLWTDEELARTAAKMKADGFNPNFPIGLFKGKILIGRNRYLAAIKAKVEFLTKDVSDEDPAKLVEMENDDRRHETQEARMARRDSRIERVAAALRNGTPTREIAEAEKVSQPTIISDKKEAADRGLSVDPPDGKVKGADDKTHPASKALKPSSGQTKRTPKPKSTNGQQVIVWSEFFASYGYLVRIIDKVGNGYGAKESPAANALRSKLEAFKKDFTSWVEFHTKEVAPRH